MADPLPGFMSVTAYRTDDNRLSWAWRCWESGDCNGHLHLDCGSETRAHRLAGQHVADRHPERNGSQS